LNVLVIAGGGMEERRLRELVILYLPVNVVLDIVAARSLIVDSLEMVDVKLVLYVGL
jgi:hypothetical protein